MLRELGLIDLILLIPSKKIEENIELLNYSIKNIEELERLAKIGRATEKAFDDGNFVLNKYEFGPGTTLKNIERFSIEELLVWAKED